MRYDFDKVIERRNTNSSKWDRMGQLFGRDDLIPMWVADMDFPCPEPVVEAIKRRAEHPIYGYSVPPDSLYEAIIDWAWTHYGWKVRREWIVFTAGVVNALYSAIKAFTHPGDEVVVQPPVYYPFMGAVRNTGCQVAGNQLRLEAGRYEMDFDQLEGLFRPATTFPARSPRIKVLVLCSPHNPVGRVWTRDELARLAEICLKYGCVLVSDEIHCDLMFSGSRHTVTATLSPEAEEGTITLMATSKTFNLAGLGTSYAIIPNAAWRRKFIEIRAGHSSGNLFGYAALEAAYRHGQDYLDQLRAYLDANLEYFAGRLAAEMPEVKLIRPEGTYLAWVDMRGLGLDPLALSGFIRNEARLALDDGYAFGTGGEGFMRFNLACPRSMVKEGLDRLGRALGARRG
jgi:cystathionine beta-lyase